MKIQSPKFWWNINNSSMRFQKWQQPISKINSPNKIGSQCSNSNLQRRHLSPIITSKSTIINQTIKRHFLMNEMISKFFNTYILFDIVLYFFTKSSSIIVNLLAGYCWCSLSSSYFDWALTVPITWHCCLFLRMRWRRSQPSPRFTPVTIILEISIWYYSITFDDNNMAKNINNWQYSK